MGPIGHTAISSVVAGGVYLATKSPSAAGITLGVGVLLDLDHLFDFLAWYVNPRQTRVYFLLHAWEYGLIGLAVLGWVYYHPFFLAAVFAQLAHVATDHFHNGLSRWAYFVSYRIIVRFDAGRITRTTDMPRRYISWLHLLPFGRQLEPWLQRKIETRMINSRED